MWARSPHDARVPSSRVHRGPGPRRTAECLLCLMKGMCLECTRCLPWLVPRSLGDTTIMNFLHFPCRSRHLQHHRRRGSLGGGGTENEEKSKGTGTALRTLMSRTVRSPDMATPRQMRLDLCSGKESRMLSMDCATQDACHNLCTLLLHPFLSLT
jgi:hypothetical protein